MWWAAGKATGAAWTAWWATGAAWTRGAENIIANMYCWKWLQERWRCGRYIIYGGSWAGDVVRNCMCLSEEIVKER